MKCSWCESELAEAHIFEEEIANQSYFATLYLCGDCKNKAQTEDMEQQAWWANLAMTHDEGMYPCMHPNEIEAVKKAINQRDIKYVFEYGSGGSTIFFPNQIHSEFFELWYSVEHNLWWWFHVKHILREHNIDNVIPILSPSSTGRWEEKHETLDEDEVIFKDYIETPLHYNISFDIFLVDGVARNGCLKVAADILPKGGCIILHDAEREDDYAEGLAYLEEKQFRPYTIVQTEIGNTVKKLIIYRKRRKIGVGYE